MDIEKHHARIKLLGKLALIERQVILKDSPKGSVVKKWKYTPNYPVITKVAAPASEESSSTLGYLLEKGREK